MAKSLFTPQPVAREPMPEPAGGWPSDEFTGHGGSYVRDPFTGLRSPALPLPDVAKVAPATDAV